LRLGAHFSNFCTIDIYQVFVTFLPVNGGRGVLKGRILNCLYWANDRDRRLLVSIDLAAEWSKR
jgi:hypothetical protein